MQTNSRDVTIALESYKKILTHPLLFSPNAWLISQIQINQLCRLAPPQLYGHKGKGQLLTRTLQLLSLHQSNLYGIPSIC